jgi:hypothetical protein
VNDAVCRELAGSIFHRRIERRDCLRPHLSRRG